MDTSTVTPAVAWAQRVSALRLAAKWLRDDNDAHDGAIDSVQMRVADDLDTLADEMAAGLGVMREDVEFLREIAERMRSEVAEHPLGRLVPRDAPEDEKPLGQQYAERAESLAERITALLPPQEPRAITNGTATPIMNVDRGK